MRYRIEVMANKRVLLEGTLTAEHTHQAVRKAADRMKKSKNIRSHEYTTLFVANEAGNIWVYNIQRKNGNFRAVPVIRANPVPKNVIMSIFAGNTNIAEVV